MRYEREILKALNEPKTFTELVTELVDKEVMSRRTLARQLDILEQDGSIEKAFDSAKKRIVYRIKSRKAKTQAIVEGLIENLGLAATYYALYKLLDKKEHEFSIEDYINSWLEPLKDEKLSFKEHLLKYLEKKHEWVMK